jgi:hypothetical protein
VRRLAMGLSGRVPQPVAHLGAIVAAYISAAYWFTASTSFANPAVTLARAVSDSFAGIRPTDVISFDSEICGRRGRGGLFSPSWRRKDVDAIGIYRAIANDRGNQLVLAGREVMAVEE